MNATQQRERQQANRIARIAKRRPLELLLQTLREENGRRIRECEEGREIDEYVHSHCDPLEWDN